MDVIQHPTAYSSPQHPDHANAVAQSLVVGRDANRRGYDRSWFFLTLFEWVNDESSDPRMGMFGRKQNRHVKLMSKKLHNV